MRLPTATHAFLALALLAGVAPSARAQSTFSAGYQLGNLSRNGTSTFHPVGFYIDVAKAVVPSVAVVGEVSGLYHALYQQNVTSFEYTYQGGVRVSANAGVANPYGQVLVGGATAGLSGGPISGTSHSAFSTQFGGGVDIKTPSLAKLRFGVDYRRVFFSDSDGGAENAVRVVLGVVFPFGR